MQPTRWKWIGLSFIDQDLAIQVRVTSRTWLLARFWPDSAIVYRSGPYPQVSWPGSLGWLRLSSLIPWFSVILNF